jgi:hypothetical protein
MSAGGISTNGSISPGSFEAKTSGVGSGQWGSSYTSSNFPGSPDLSL